MNPRQPNRGAAGFVYLRPALPMPKIKAPDHRMVLYEAHDTFGDGLWVGFADGHVRFIEDEARFKALLKAVAPGQGDR